MSLNPASRAILLRTYAGDAEWLPYLFKSCEIHAPETPIIMVYPKKDHNRLAQFAERSTASFKVYPHHKDGYIDQQWTKLHADEFCNSDYVIHLDSDCVVLRSLDDLFVGRKPIMLKTPYRLMEGDSLTWRGVTAGYVGFNPDYEYMRRQPLVYPRHAYKAVRGFVEKVKGPWHKWFPKISNRSLSEYNVIGAVCDKELHDDFHWIDTEFDPLPPLVVRQGWSWGGIDKVRAEWEALVNGEG